VSLQRNFFASLFNINFYSRQTNRSFAFAKCPEKLANSLVILAMSKTSKRRLQEVLRPEGRGI
jgi:hypothetical protein